MENIMNNEVAVPAQTELMQVTQLPIIKEQLRSAKAAIEARLAQIETLACTEDTIQVCRKARAELREEYALFEDGRKAVKQAILQPYEDFEKEYKECVGDAYKRADAALKSKIDGVTDTIIQECEQELRDYFNELIVINNVEWLTFERINCKITFTDAKQATHKKLREYVLHTVASIANAISALSEMENADELIVEFKKNLDMPLAIQTVQERHRQVEAQRRESEERTLKAGANTARPSESATEDSDPSSESPKILKAPNVVQGKPDGDDDKVYKTSFTVRGTLAQLKALKAYMLENGITIQ